ncbi:unnamed protein product [Schistosoma rodhaini]|nr:unnamed protein product [Schistosoma rodhaini]
MTIVFSQFVYFSEMSTNGTDDGPLESDLSWVSTKTSFMTISDPSDSSTPNANSSLDETFASNKFSPNSFRNSSPKSDELEDNDYDNSDKDKEEQVKHKKKTGITLVYAPEKSVNIFKSSENSIVPPQLNEKVIIIRSDQGNDNNYTENDTLPKKNGIGSTTASSMNEILYSSKENLSKLNDEHELIKQLNNSNNVLYNNSFEEFSSNNEISDGKDLSDNDDNSNNNNLSDNDSKYNNSSSILSTQQVLTSLNNHNDSSVLSMGSKTLSKEILNDDDNNNDNNQSYANNTISVNEDNDITDTVLQNHEEITKNTSSIDQTEEYTSTLKSVLSSPSNHSIDSDQEYKLLTDHSSIKPNLNNIAQMNSESDDEVTKTVLNISDQYKKTVNKFVEQSMPTYLDRCSPAQIVAVTGGALPDIIRNIEEDLDEVNDDNVIEVLNTDAEHETNPSASSSMNPSNIVRQRGHNSESLKSQKPVTINIDLRVVSMLTPSTPEEVDASSELVFSNFMIDRYRLEVSASAQASSSQSTASSSASIHVTAIGQEAESEDPVSHQLSSLPRAEPHSVEAIVARNLAEIGDEINRMYGPRLDRMIKLLPVEECPLEMFYNVARVLFARGPTNWGQVITLFYFGYRLVVQRVKKGVANAFYQVCRCLVSFCRQINIFVWIAQQGGWRILQFLRSHRTYDDDDENVDKKNHSTKSNVTSHTDDESYQQNTSLNNNPSFDNSDNDSQLFVPLVLTSTGFVVIAFALWYYLRR